MILNKLSKFLIVFVLIPLLIYITIVFVFFIKSELLDFNFLTWSIGLSFFHFFLTCMSVLTASLLLFGKKLGYCYNKKEVDHV